MDRLFWGLFFCLLDIKKTVGTAVFDLFPDFIGFFLVMKGMEALAGENKFFDRGRHWSFGMIIVSVILYTGDLMDPDTMTKVWLWALGFGGLAAELVILRQAVRGIGQMEKDHGLDLHSERLRAMWLALAVLGPVCHLLNWIPLVGTVCAVAQTVTGACFLVAMFDTKKRLIYTSS